MKPECQEEDDSGESKNDGLIPGHGDGLRVGLCTCEQGHYKDSQRAGIDKTKRNNATKPSKRGYDKEIFFH